MKKEGILISAVILAAIAATITAILFKTRFAKVTIDAWSFGASSFLVIEALYKIHITKDKFWPNQFFRFLRIVIGICIFTIHTCQVVYGV